MGLKTAMRNADQKTIRAVASKVGCPIKAAVVDNIVAAISSGNVEKLRMLLQEYCEVGEGDTRKRRKYPMSILGQKSLLSEVSGEVAGVLLETFAAEQQDLEKALIIRARNGADMAVNVILGACYNMLGESSRKTLRNSHRESVSINLVSSLTISLIAAASGGHDGVVKQLLAARARLQCGDLDSVNALRLACREGHKHVVLILLQEFSYETSTIDEMAMVAAAAGKAETTHTTLAARPQPHVLQPLLLALAEKNLLESVVCILTQLGMGSAASVDRIGSDVVNGSNVDDDLKRAVDVALAEASGRGDADAMRLLLAANADANALNGLPLQRAAAIGDCATLKLLLDARACVHVMNEAPLRAAMYYRQAPVTRMLMEAGADGTKVKDDLLVLCHAAAQGGNGYRSRVVNDAKAAALEESKHAARVLGATALHSELAALQSEMQNEDADGHGGPFSAAIIECVKTALKQKRTKPYATLMTDAVLTVLGMALPIAQMGMIRLDCERRVAEQYHPKSTSASSFQKALAELASKEAAVNVALVLICENHVYADEVDVRPLIVAISHLFGAEKYTKHLSMLFSTYDLSVQRAMRLGVPVNLLLKCIHDRNKLVGTGLTGKWAWCLLRRLCLDGPGAVSRYFAIIEFRLSPGNPGYLDAMHSFYDTAKIADSLI
mmetsp:Transcript_34061/g.71720  ORF Transcript_34061/g.71720 Transcript_34061/m.71720 type:complete len:668 (-) Transcript_34061:584-2587(-)